MEPIEMKLKAKYLIRFTPKFQGKKRHAGNSGRTGRAYRASLRCLVPGKRGK